MAKGHLVFFAMILATVILAQTVSAAALTSTIEDPVGDAHFVSGRLAPPYMDVVRAAIAFDEGEFAFAMDVAAAMPAAPALPPGAALLAWTWNLNTNPATFPAGWPFPPSDAIPPEFQVWLLWDGTGFSGIVVDRRPLLTGGDVVITSVPIGITGAEARWSVQAALLGSPSSFSWKIRTTVWWGPFGSNGVQHLDAAPDDPGFVRWPS